MHIVDNLGCNKLIQGITKSLHTYMTFRVLGSDLFVKGLKYVTCHMNVHTSKNLLQLQEETNKKK